MTTVLAYLDPGSGSMILQIIAGGLAAVAVTAKLYWNRILKFLRIRKDEPETARSPRRRRPPTPPSRAPARPGRGRSFVSYLPSGPRGQPTLRCQRLRRTQKPAPAASKPGSFRDPESRVFYAGDEVYRALSADGLSDFEALETSGLLEDARVVGTERARHGRAQRPPRARARGGLAPRADPVRLLPLRVDVLDAQGRGARPARPPARRARSRPRAQGLDALQRAVQGRAGRCSWTSAPSSASARESRGSATASSACSTCTRCFCSPRRACRSSPGCVDRSTASRPVRCAR